MNTDGSNPTRLTSNGAFDSYPAWSPEGALIAFTSDRDGSGQIYVMHADGSNQRRLTDDPARDTNPSWSADGHHILFDSVLDGNRDIYVMDADGSNRRRLTEHRSMDWSPAWSPDGKSIVFASMRDGNSEIYVMNSDGSNQTRLTSNLAFDSYPAWSPDGKSIAFASTRDGNSEVYVMRADGSDQRRLTNSQGIDSNPRWAPDGGQIVFDSLENGARDIYTMNADGSDLRRLTSQRSTDSYPDWSPEGWTAPQRTPPAGPYYLGKSITIVSPAVPGDANDLWSRLVARHIGRFIPGSPIVLVRNMPGEDGQNGTRYVHNRAKADGLTLLSGSVSRSRSFRLGEKGAEFNPAEAPVVLAHPISTVMLIRSGLISRPADIAQVRGLAFGGISATAAIEFVLTKELLAIKTDKVTFGYLSYAEVRRGLLAGEVNLTQYATPNYRLMMQPLVKKGDYTTLCQSGLLDAKGNLIRDPSLPNVPTAAELYQQIHGRPPSGPAWEAYRTLAADRTHILHMAPGAPDNLTATIREAALAMLNDPAFLADSRSVMGESHYAAGEEAMRVFRGEAVRPEILRWVRDLLQKEYGMKF